MTYYKKNTHSNEWNRNQQDDAQAYPDGVVRFVIHHKDQWACTETYCGENDASDKFPFPGDDQDDE